MSKQRPSKVRRPGPASAPASSLASRADGPDWRGRVFRNTFTRGGRRFQVKGWSVKIQHEGLRRTFSLRAKEVEAAAREAQTIYETLVTQGWAAALSALGPRTARRGSGPARRPFDALEGAVPAPEFRLVHRPSPSRPNAEPGIPCSALIRHDGAWCYFPVKAREPGPANAEVREIYQCVIRNGWAAASGRYPRELTVALRWAGNPVAWTYFTLLTRPKAGARSSACPPGSSVRVPIVIVEPDPTVRRGLAECINVQEGFRVLRWYRYGGEAARELPGLAPHLVLANQALPEMAEAEWLVRLEAAAPHCPVVLHSIHPDSDQLFRAPPGGAQGYLLKRTAPSRILEPILGLPDAPPLSKETVSVCVRRYFQQVIRSLSTSAADQQFASLTAREREILHLLARGSVDKEIAEALGISSWTVHGHLKHIFEKLGVHSRTEAVVRYLEK